jgi:hypothetical protein
LTQHKKWSYASQSSRQQTVANVEANLRVGIPSVYCRSGHCVMIYGFKSDGTKATEFHIADSVPGRFYTESVDRVAQRYSAMWTQPRSGISYTSDRSAPVTSYQYENDSYYDAFPASTGTRE